MLSSLASLSHFRVAVSSSTKKEIKKPEKKITFEKLESERSDFILLIKLLHLYLGRILNTRLLLLSTFSTTKSTKDYLCISLSIALWENPAQYAFIQ